MRHVVFPLALLVGLLGSPSALGAPRVAVGEFRATGQEARAFGWALLAREGLRQQLQQVRLLDLVEVAGAPEFIVTGSVGGPVGTSILAVKVHDVSRDVLVASHFYPFGLADALPRAVEEAARTVIARLIRPRPGAVLLSDGFTDASLSGYEIFVPPGLGRDLTVEEGALRLRSSVAILSRATLPRDAILRFQMRFEDNVRAQLSLLFSSQVPYPRQNYEVSLFPDRFFVQFREGIARNLRPGQLLSLSPWQWYDVSVEVWNGEIRLWIDGVLVATTRDTFEQLKSGQIGFRGSECWIDNLRVFAIDGVRDP